MSGDFQTPVSIQQALVNIEESKYLLPAIQRKFVWSAEQIERLFDSILRGYPINSFMFWHIKDEKLKLNYKFYRVLDKYKEFYAETNPEVNAINKDEFYAVIDGQQRLTSLNIGLRGTYAYRMPRKHRINNEQSYPTRVLYLNLERPLQRENDTDKEYEFKFLSATEVKQKSAYWFKVQQILILKDNSQVATYAAAHNWLPGSFAYETLFKLFSAIHMEKRITYYLEQEQNPDRVLEVFIRTNSGGTPLSFSDLLMSMSTANWHTLNARDEMEKLRKEVFACQNMGFEINHNFILKTCLVLCVKDIKFQLKNFTRENIALFETNWSRIRACILAGVNLLYHLGYNNYTFQAKRALIPLIYYIYKNNLENRIILATYSKEDRKQIQKWLNISFLKEIFGGHPDAVLTKLRRILDKNQGKPFPFEQIVEQFKGEAKNYTFDDDFAEALLLSQKDTKEAGYALAMLYPDKNFYEQSYHADHLHPQSRFKVIAEAVGRTEQEVYAVGNSVLNLQLLDGRTNESKNDKPLAVWAKEQGVSNEQLYVPANTSLEEKDFLVFIEKRKEYLKNKLKALV